MWGESEVCENRAEETDTRIPVLSPYPVLQILSFFVAALPFVWHQSGEKQ